MTLHYFADKNADTVLIQPIGEHDMAEIENEATEIKKAHKYGLSAYCRGSRGLEQ